MRAHDRAPGYIFVAPKGHPGQNGPMILDEHGQLVWSHPLQARGGIASDFKVQRYQGKPVLTWAEGKVVAGHGITEYVILNDSYQEITRVRAGNGYQGDLHEFLVTPEDTALMTIYNPVRRDLTPLGVPQEGLVWEGIVQEVGIETGEVLFEWHSLDHVGLDESYGELPKKPENGFDYFHINSIDVDHDSNLLVCGHTTFTVYKVDRRSGEVIWRLGGKKSDFEMGPGTRTRYQHDARRQPDGTITIFDNGGVHKDEQSRGIVLELDIKKMSATLVSQYIHPDKRLAATMGNMQVLSNGNVFFGWGTLPSLSRFNSDGELLFDAKFPPKIDSYRSFCFPWRGHPNDGPVVAVEQGPDDEQVTLYASWNGATEVATWEVLAGLSPGQLEFLGSAPRDGFETALLARTAERYVAVRAKHSSGRVLGASKPIKLGG